MTRRGRMLALFGLGAVVGASAWAVSRSPEAATPAMPTMPATPGGVGAVGGEREVGPASRRVRPEGADAWDRLDRAQRRALAEAAVTAAIADPRQTHSAQRRLSAARADFCVDEAGRQRYLVLEQALTNDDPG